MEREIRKGIYGGSIKARPSKSDAHRLLICGGLADGVSTLHGISRSEDMEATVDCLKSLGASCTRDGETVTVRGKDPLKRGEALFPCRESGSTMRFFIPLALLSESGAEFTGSEKLLSRPLDVYEKICLEQGLYFENDGKKLMLQGPLSGGYFKVRGDISSQFISGLMFALPLLEGYSVIETEGPVVSAPYIAMTADTLSAFGIREEITEDGKILIPGGQKYLPQEAETEGDWSNAAFFLALSFLRGNDIEVTGLERDTLQGDAVINRLLPRLVRTRLSIDIENCPDLAPVIMAFSSLFNGCFLTGTDRLGLKESDRGRAMASELAKFGVPVAVGDNCITVTAPGKLKKPDMPVDGHNDHRIVMACSVLLTKTGGTVSGAEAVNKSYPEFFDDLDSLYLGPSESEEEKN